MKHLPYVDDRLEAGVFRVHPGVYADQALYELEHECIFERTWSFLALESQLPAPNDFLTHHIGRVPVLVMRDARSRLGAFLNVCRHKGALLCAQEQGKAKYHVCPYHGWAYDAAGENVHIKDRESGCYAPAFDAEEHGLVPIARLASYKGLVFGSLSSDVPPLEDFLGEVRFFLDLVLDQGPNGMEFVPGRSVYTYRGNWKLQLENGLDPYHLTTTHQSFIALQARRRAGDGHIESRSYDWTIRAAAPAGAFGFAHGHSVVWSDQTEPEKRPIYPVLDEIRSRVGPLRAQWMLKARNTQIFPNTQLGDAISPTLRTFRPLAVDCTEVRSYCLAPIGEAPELRAWRLRQFEDFFNPAGMATPDDNVVYDLCQRGVEAKPMGFLQGHARGMTSLEQGPGEIAARLGIRPELSVQGRFDMFAEAGFHAPYREWHRLLRAGRAGEAAYP